MTQQLTPMMKQYTEIKEKYKEEILFFRLGDFYEMFLDDAIIASKEMEIALTARDGGNTKVPMCGVPYHAAQIYIARLIKKGYKVAICEQIGDPKTSKGIVKRDVVKIITPGTVIDDDCLDKTKNNYIVSLINIGTRIGLAYIDFSTGEFNITEFNTNTNYLTAELIKLSPVELICNNNIDESIINWLKTNFNTTVNYMDDHFFTTSNAKKYLLSVFQNEDYDSLGLSQLNEGVRAAGALIKYLSSTQKENLTHLRKPNLYHCYKFMALDTATIRNLELMVTLKEQKQHGSLLGILEKTITAIGSRLLRRWLNQPLIDVDLIHQRQEAISEFASNYTDTLTIRSKLKEVYDLERLIGKLNTGNATPLDLLSLKQSLNTVPELKKIIPNNCDGLIKNTIAEMDNLYDVVDLVEQAINPNVAINAKVGEIIKEGYSNEIDELRTISKDGKKWLLELEQRERDRTGIKSLKIGYNKVFGYYLETRKTNLDSIPSYYERKQTLANSERYIIDELKEFENRILGAEEKLSRLEQEAFNNIKKEIIKTNYRIQQTAAALGQIDVLTTLAFVAINNNYHKPIVNTSTKIILKEARHPVIEQLLTGQFVANDIYLDTEKEMIQIITGPNMAGKSTYARTAALITLLAQIGSFVPASYAEIGIVDRIFARVGASDDLTSGQSTFMVEMNEVANILRNATNKSLIILDEVGRGTSTFDGLSIAWAITTYLHDQINAKTIFTTHYHELTELATTMPKVKNYNVMVSEKDGAISFLYKIVSGSANKSYGIQVAQLAGLPKQLLDNAKQVLVELENSHKHETAIATQEIPNCEQCLFVAESKKNQQLYYELVKKIQQLDINALTPLEALNFLAHIKNNLI